MNSIVSAENERLAYSILQVLGDRENQEDSYAYRTLENGSNSIFIVCDGMGGQDVGERASTMAVDKFVNEFDTGRFNANPSQNLVAVTHEANQQVCSITDENGNRMHAGTTLVAVLIQNDNLYWSSVGDSRLYILRNEDFIQVTVDHNYKEYLIEKYNAGEINMANYLKEMSGNKTEALLSFLGLDSLQLINNNVVPFKLMKDDILVIMSDGLYKLLNDSEIKGVIDNFKNLSDAVSMLNQKAEKASDKLNICRDNTTITLVRIK